MLEDGIKRLPGNSSGEKHFFKFEDMEEVWITSYGMINHHYQLVIKDKSGHTNMITNCRINCNNLMNIYSALKSLIISKYPKSKTRFRIDYSYNNELAENNEWELKLKKQAENAKMHNEKHIPQNLFENNCEYCSKNKYDYMSSPNAYINLQRLFKNWVGIQNKNYFIYDNSRELSELKLFGISWDIISSVSFRTDGSAVNYRDSKSNTNKMIQKYIITIKITQGLTKDYPVYLFTENESARVLKNHINDYLNKFKKRPLVSTEILDLRF